MAPNMSSVISVENKEYVTSLVRGLAVIRCFDKSRCKFSLTEVAKHTDKGYTVVSQSGIGIWAFFCICTYSK